jgi:hypothetical protein
MPPKVLQSYRPETFLNLLDEWKTNSLSPAVEAVIERERKAAQRPFEEYKKQKEKEIQLLRDQIPIEPRGTGVIEQTQGSLSLPF